MNKLSILSFVAGAVLKIIGLTFRIRKIKAVDITKIPCVCAFWHGDLLASFYINRNLNAAVMISMSKDGEIPARIADRFGYIAVRGSSSRGGGKALTELVKYAKEGYITAFAVDGPKGPRHKIKPGILFLAQNLQIPIIPISAIADKNIIVGKSWDKFKIPLPFSKIAIVYGMPVSVLPQDNIEEKTSELEKALHKTTDFAANYAWSRDVKQYLKNHPKPKILIIQPSRMGDVIFALPAVNAIKKQYPHAQISWFVDERCAEILKGSKIIDDLIIFDRKKISPAYIVKFYKLLRKNEYDLSIDFHGLFKSAFIVKLAGAKFKLASSSTNGMRELSWLFSKEIKPKSEDTHCIERHLAVSQYLGCDTSEQEYGIDVPQSDIEALKKLLEKEKVDLSKKIVAVHPGGGWISRRWQTEKFARLIDLIKEKYGANIVLVGGKEGGASEKGLNEEIILQSATKDIIDLTGKLNIKELMAFFKICSLFIANEAGPMHIATAFNTNAIAILGPTNARRTGPFKGNTLIIQKKVKCQPCRNRKCVKVECMKLISVEDVFEAACKKLGV